MARILVINRSFFNYSETFIYRQVLSLAKTYSLILMGFRFQNENVFPMPDAKRIHLRYYVNLADRIITRVLRKILRLELPFSLLTGFGVHQICKRNKIDVIHAHYGWNGIAMLSYAKQFNIPLIVSFHGVDASYSLKKQRYRKQLLSLFEYASLIILCSPYMLKNLSLGKYQNKVRIVPYGIDVDIFSPTAINVKKNKIKILHVGRLVAKKGVPDLIRVFDKLRSQFPFVELQIIGGGKELDECKMLAESKHLGKDIIFSGPQPNDVVLKALRDCDIFVLNSRTDDDGDQEGLPNGLLEAMSCGRPVVSTYHAGIPDAIIDNVNGLLVNERNNDELLDALARVVVDGDLRNRLGVEARATVVNSFSILKMESDLCQLIEETVLRSGLWTQDLE